MIGMGLALGVGPLLFEALLSISSTLPFVLVALANLSMLLGLCIKWDDDILEIRDSYRNARNT